MEGTGRDTAWCPPRPSKEDELLRQHRRKATGTSLRMGDQVLRVHTREMQVRFPEDDRSQEQSTCSGFRWQKQTPNLMEILIHNYFLKLPA